MSRAIAVVTLAVLMMIAVSSQGQTTIQRGNSSLPEDSAATVEELLDISADEFPSSGTSPSEYKMRLAAAHEKFLDLLKTLGQQVDDELAKKIAASETATIERNLIDMARDYGTNPDHYRDLVNFYGVPSNPRLHVPDLRPLKELHAVEQYRAAWELLLLAPTTKKSRFLRPRCYEAIKGIGNDASIPLLQHLFERANLRVVNDPSHRALDEQVYVLSALARYHNVLSLHALLRCVEIAEAIPEPRPRESGFTTKQRVVHYLRYKDDRGNREQWRAVMEEALQGKLSDADRSFLKGVLKSSDGKGGQQEDTDP